MIKLQLLFSPSDAVAVFRNAGLEVESYDMPVYFNAPHGDGKTEMMPMWTVRNPHTSKIEKLDEFFLKYLESKKNELFLNPEKLEIYNLFSKK